MVIANLFSLIPKVGGTGPVGQRPFQRLETRQNSGQQGGEPRETPRECGRGGVREASGRLQVQRARVPRGVQWKGLELQNSLVEYQWSSRLD